MAKIRVKLGVAEAEVEADLEHLKEAIELVPDLLAKIPPTDGQRSVPLAAAQVRFDAVHSNHVGLSQLPAVTLEKTDSLADVIGKFFADSWGRERRKLSDVREALQSYGLNYPKQSVAVALLRLAKATKIRRFKAEDGEFVYTVLSPVSVAPIRPRDDLPMDEFTEAPPN
jgi:hypothetical protein